MDQKVEQAGAAAQTGDGPIETDAVIVGAGPVGLFQVFELGLLEIKAHIIDSLAHAGGQCIELYPDKPIYDIPAVPVCTGRELTESLLKQIAPFHATFHLGQEVSVVHKRDDGRFDVATNRGTRLIAKTVFIAGGVGSFQPRRLKIDAIDAFEGSQLFYAEPDASALAGQRVVVIGDSDIALEWALRLVDQRAHVTLMHRRDEFKAAPAIVERVRQLRAGGQ
ncbi:MAG TPA: NAD(P)/FAD-dependent oxidoreductase, partial [Burkholderiaceae bacterium]|nr:NAD(P)/FAD-dependent oxidoreductase [Burkholderiaceae bacterium]